MKKLSLLVIFVCLLAGGCKNSASTPKGPARLDVFVSITPEKFLVDRIGGDRVSVSVLVPPAREPHTYEPTGKQISNLGKSVVFFRTGVPFEEALIPRVKELFPKLPIVDLRRGVTLLTMTEECEHEHEGEGEHAHEHEHAHESGDHLDPHVWMSPAVMKIQATTVRDELVKLDPAGAKLYNANYDKLIADLTQTQQHIAKVLAPFKGKTFFVFHPAFGYLANEFGLTQEAVEVEGKSPTASQLQKLIDKARKENVRIIFVQPQFSKHAAESVAKSINGAVIPLDTLAEDYITNLNKVADEISKALGGEKTAK
jgi:zinc transport system substrate-binding protein